MTDRTRHLLGISLLGAVMLAGCELRTLVAVDAPSPECASNPEPAMCEEALDAVAAEVGDLAEGGQIRIDPVTCAHGRCWTWAYLTPAGGGREHVLSIDWLADGISITHVVGH